MYKYPNPDNKEALFIYNDICQNGIPFNQLRGEKKKDIRAAGYSLHHIIPRSFNPLLTYDPENMVYLPFDQHADAHYYLWKGLESPESAMAFWFIYIWGSKNEGYHIPEEDDYILREDVSTYLKIVRKNKEE